MSRDAADPQDPARSARCAHSGGERWTAGADGIRAAVPVGRLHAVAARDLIAGRAVCRAPVLLLDPAGWHWPDDGGPDRPLCWTCLRLTC
jgi:hypothetical protein